MNFSINIDMELIGEDDDGFIVRLSQLAADAAHTVNLNLPDELRISGVNVSSYDAVSLLPGEELVALDASEARLHEVPFDPAVNP